MTSAYWGGKVTAPFTPDQVESLNAYQVSGVFHEFTCGSDEAHENEFNPPLIAAEGGWVCSAPLCDYTQDWAHGAMADWSWKRVAAGEWRPPESGRP